MSKSTLNNLYEWIENEKEIIEFMKTFEFHCKMFDLEVFMEYTPLSFFDIHVIDQDYKMSINFEFNARKKYLEKITLEYKENYNIQLGYFKNHKVITSGIIAPDFMSPLEEAMKIIAQ